MTTATQDRPSDQTTRFLVTGQQLDQYSALKQINYTTDIEEPFDIIALLPGAEREIFDPVFFHIRLQLIDHRLSKRVREWLLLIIRRNNVINGGERTMRIFHP